MFDNKRIIAFVIYAICLLGIPAKMILDQQAVFNEGTAYKFKCQPMDPNDPFRGKYVRLGFDRIEAPVNKQTSSNLHYGIISIDDNGYAHVSKVVHTYDPAQVMIELNLNYSNDSISVFTLPFDRLYMNEDKAQAAEDLYRHALRDDTQDVYAKVYISEGRFFLDDVYVNGSPLKDMVE